MIYELINPSDCTTFHANDDKIAYFCALLIGGGHYGLSRMDGLPVESPLLFLTENPVAIAEGYLEMSISDFGERNAAALCEAFDSFAYVSFSDRPAFDLVIETIKTPQVLKAFLKGHESKARSSMTKIVQRAWKMANHFSKQTA